MGPISGMRSATQELHELFDAFESARVGAFTVVKTCEGEVEFIPNDAYHQVDSVRRRVRGRGRKVKNC